MCVCLCVIFGNTSPRLTAPSLLSFCFRFGLVTLKIRYCSRFTVWRVTASDPSSKFSSRIPFILRGLFQHDSAPFTGHEGSLNDLMRMKWNVLTFKVTRSQPDGTRGGEKGGVLEIWNVFREDGVHRTSAAPVMWNLCQGVVKLLRWLVVAENALLRDFMLKITSSTSICLLIHKDNY